MPTVQRLLVSERGSASGVARLAPVVFGVLAAWTYASLSSDPAVAAPPPVSVPIEPESFEPTQPTTGPFGFLTGLSRSNYLLGDMWGLRTLLSQYGISFALQETSEVFGNVTGGVRQGAEYDGLTQAVVQMDTQRAFGWYGGTFNASALQIHGRNLSADNLLTLQTASGIEADRATRLWELWYQQKFGSQDRFNVRIGQQSLDQEFMVSQNASYFINTMFGWPMLPSANLPGGGPAYPLSAPGVRFRARPTQSLTVLAGVFSGSPLSTDAPGDPQQLNPSGTTFPWNGTLAITELQYSYPSLGTMLYPNESEPLGRTYKLGFWYDTKQFADQQFDNTGLSLANPASTGVPEMHRGDWAVYAVADQAVWVDAEEPDRTLNVFIRPMGTPLADRNLITFSLNAGIVFHEPILHRDDDTFGIGMGYAHVSGRAAALDRDTAEFTGSFTPVRSGETFVEVTYQYQATPWWQLQPDFQYVFNPGAGVANPNAPTQPVKDEAVFGLRTNILF
ncbi:MAG TPA: carbohydrate porin [Stellaceae bacterium]|nr:carbohydrate porin [Stellaceae bacterium]